MKNRLMLAMLLLLPAGIVRAAFSPTTETFGTNTVGQAVNFGSWSSVNAIITNTPAYSASRSVALGEASAVTNAVAETGLNSRVWTDMRVQPRFGPSPTNDIPADLSLLFFFDEDRHLNTYDGTNWVLVGSNVWGEAFVAPTNAWLRLSVFKDYAEKTYAVMVDDVVVVQDQPFLTNTSQYASFSMQNEYNNAFLDNVRVDDSLPSGFVSTNSPWSSANGSSDAWELNHFGYVSRILAIDNVDFSEVRVNDVVELAAGTYETLNVVSGVTVRLTGNVTVSNATIYGVVYLDTHTLSVTNELAFVNAAPSITNGIIHIGSGILDADDITMDSGTQITSDGGTLENPLLGLSGTFVINGADWGDASVLTAQALPFYDDFEGYQANQEVRYLGPYGWLTTNSSVVVTNGISSEGSRSVMLPDGTGLELSISAASHTRIWTEFYLRPNLGPAPEDAGRPQTAGYAFISLIDTNGNMNVWNATSNKYIVVTNTVDGVNTPVLSAFAPNAFTKVSVFQNFATQQCAVYLSNTNLVAMEYPFASSVSSYSGMYVANDNNLDVNVYVDAVRVIATLPFDPSDIGYVLLDRNGNGMDDREEIHWFGNLSTYSGVRSTIFRFR
jgi:hypothetical protein